MDTCVGCLPDIHLNKFKKTHILKRYFQHKEELFEPYLERKAGNCSISIYNKVIPIPLGKSLLGNKSICRDFHIDGPEVEENHCFLIREGYLVTLSPIATSTFVDGHRVIKPVKLENNVLLRFGKSNIFRIKLPQLFHINQWNTPGYLTRSDIKEIQQKNFVLTKNQDLKSCCDKITELNCSPSICKEFLKVICRDQIIYSTNSRDKHIVPSYQDSVHKKHNFHNKELKFDELKSFILTQAKKRISSSKSECFKNIISDCNTCLNVTSSSLISKNCFKQNYALKNSINVSKCCESLHNSSFDARSYSDSAIFIPKHFNAGSLTFLIKSQRKFKKLERSISVDSFLNLIIKSGSSDDLFCINKIPQQHTCFTYKQFQRSIIKKILKMDDQDLENLSSSERDLKSLYERQKIERLKEQERAIEEERRLNELMDLLSCEVATTHGRDLCEKQSSLHHLDSEGSPVADSGVGFCSPDLSQNSQKSLKKPQRTSLFAHRSSSEDRQFLTATKCDLKNTNKQFLLGASLLDNTKFHSDSKIWNETNHETQSFYDLQKDVMQNISEIKNKYSEVEAQQNEIHRELEVERALLDGEHEILFLQLKDVQNKMADIEGKEIDLTNDILVRKDQDVVKSERFKLKDFETKRKCLEMKLSKDGSEVIGKKLEEAQELEENQRCLVENLEFQLLEGESKLEDEKETNLIQLREEKDELIQSCRMYRENMDQITSQRIDLNNQTELELAAIENNKQLLNKQLQKECSMLMKINQQIEILEFNPLPWLGKSGNISNFPKRKYNDCGDGPIRDCGDGPIGELRLSSRTLPQYNSNSLALHMINGNKYKKSFVPAFTPQKSDLFQKASSWLAITSSDNSDDASSVSGGSDDNSALSYSNRGEHFEKIREMECQLILAKAEKMKIIDKKKFLEEKESTLQEEKKKMNEKKNDSNKLIISLEANESFLHIPATDQSIDLLAFVRSRGHDPEECHHVILTPSCCRGFLTKMTGRFRGHLRMWKKRWFLFDRKKRCLSYYCDKKESKPRNVMYFQSIQNVFVDHLHQVNSPTPQLTFCVKTYERAFYLVAPSLSALRIWVDIIFTGAEAYQYS